MMRALIHVAILLVRRLVACLVHVPASADSSAAAQQPHGQHRGTLTANPPRAVSLYLERMSRPVAFIAAMA